MDEFQQFANGLLRLTGVDLHLYKRAQMERRLIALRDRYGFHDFASFLNAVSSDATLRATLMDRITINVSEFFRNPERWESLRALLDRYPRKEGFKAWSAACSTGEEPYTLAIVLSEMGLQRSKILATDIDVAVLNAARAGRYRQHQVKLLPHSVGDKYFSIQGEEWIIADLLKEQITFNQNNLLADTYPTAQDLIICRNVLIYFTEDAKQAVIEGLAKSLKPNGLLFLGSTEQLLHAEKFGLRSVAPFIYERNGGG